MKRISSVLVFFLIVVPASGCKINTTQPNDRKTVITTLFPQYDFTKQIAKDKVYVRMILPPGMESHSYEPTPKDIADIKKSSLFIYTGKYMEPWAEKLIATRKNESPVIVDISKNIVFLEEKDHNEENHSHHGEFDPHIWTDPVNALTIVDNILEGLIQIDPDNGGFYRTNAEAYKKELIKLDNDFKTMLRKAKYRQIIYGGHFAFGYFAKRYGLTHISPYKGFSPDAEPTPQSIARIIKTISSSGGKCIYYEEMIDPKIARVISRQTGAKMLLLNGAHNVTKKELESNITYITIMRENLERLKAGLVYSE